MSKRMPVGRSWRTDAKHDQMCGFVGKESGAAGCMPWVNRLVWRDLSAGDAAPIEGVEWSKACSPGILASYAAGSLKPVDVELWEIKANTFDRLVSNLDLMLPSLDVGYAKYGDECWRLGDLVTIRAINASGHDVDVSSIRHTDAVLVLNDPNAITEWAMRDSLAREIGARTRWFRSMSTMGCNPGGLKRLDAEERAAWFGLVGAQQSALPVYRDLLLVAIERDESQWAYLFSTAVKWRSSAESVARTAFNKISRSTVMAWYRQDPQQFEDIKRTLFLTKKERGDAA